jgi:hypothetical protein
VTDKKTAILDDISKQKQIILVGTLGKNKWIDELVNKTQLK